jgi:N-acetyl-gamma-glutamyl-phosphate reductase
MFGPERVTFSPSSVPRHTEKSMTISPNGNGRIPGTRPRVLVAGALGAIGSLAAELIDAHPSFELAAVTTRDKDAIGRKFHELYPEHRLDLELRNINDVDFSDFDAAIVGWKQGAAAALCRELLAAGLIVVDSCADFRFSDQRTYEKWYDEHQAPDLIEQAVYGLPEVNREKLTGARLIGNPGCYPTAAVLALAPLAREGLIDDLVIDAKSGVSGAGKRGGSAPTFVGADENIRPYGIPGHRHEPEIAEQLGKLGYGGNFSFVPHLIPIDQGELVSCYVTPSREIRPEELHELYTSAYDSEEFVEIASELPAVREVNKTNICRIFPVLDHDGSRVFVFATLDNLWKGGASQAIQNLNLAFDVPEATGIPGGTAVRPSTETERVERATASARR